MTPEEFNNINIGDVVCIRGTQHTVVSIMSGNHVKRIIAIAQNISLDWGTLSVPAHITEIPEPLTLVSRSVPVGVKRTLNDEIVWKNQESKLKAKLASVERRRDELWDALKYHSTPKEGSLEKIHEEMPEGTACARCGWAKPEASRRVDGHVQTPDQTKCQFCGVFWEYAPLIGPCAAVTNPEL